MNILFSLSILAAFLLVLPSNAHAYLDPGTGSIILQVVAAAVLGALFTVKVYWQKTKDFFAGLFGKRS